MVGKSKLITNIYNLDIDRLFHRQSLVKGFNYYKQDAVQTMYSPRQDELISYVQGAENYCVHFRMQGNRILNKCTCPVGENCKHAIASMYVVKNNYQLFDNDCSVEDFKFGLYQDPTFDELFRTLVRLVGPKYMLNIYVEGDFNLLYKKLCNLVIKEIRNNDIVCIDHFNALVPFITKINYHSSSVVTIDVNKTLYQLVEAIILTKNSNYIDSLISNPRGIGFDYLIDCLGQYEEEHSESEFATSILDQIINKVQNYDGEVSDKANVLIANNYLLHNKIKFRQFARKNINNQEIRQMYIQSLFFEKAYQEIIDIFKDIKPVSQKEYATYISSLMETNHECNDIVLEFLIKFASIENIKLLKNYNINEEIIKNGVLSYSYSLGISDRIKFLIKLGYKDVVVKMIKEEEDEKEVLNVIHSHFKQLITSPEDELFLFYQELIFSNFTKIARRLETYVDDFDNLECGGVYKALMYNELCDLGYIDKYYRDWYIRSANF